MNGSRRAVQLAIGAAVGASLAIILSLSPEMDSETAEIWRWYLRVPVFALAGFVSAGILSSRFLQRQRSALAEYSRWGVALGAGFGIAGVFDALMIESTESIALWVFPGSVSGVAVATVIRFYRAA
jgi:hypothetical protein